MKSHESSEVTTSGLALICVVPRPILQPSAVAPPKFSYLIVDKGSFESPTRPMDPVTIVGSVSAAIKTTYWISTTLYTLTNSSRGINKSLVDLHDEVEGLNVVLRSVELSLKKPSIACMKKDGENQGAWPSLNVAIRHTQLTVDGLKQIVERLGTVPKSANIFKKSVKQIHLNLNADEISGVKDRLRTHTANLQLALQLAIL